MDASSFSFPAVFDMEPLQAKLGSPAAAAAAGPYRPRGVGIVNIIGHGCSRARKRIFITASYGARSTRKHGQSCDWAAGIRMDIPPPAFWQSAIQTVSPCRGTSSQSEHKECSSHTISAWDLASTYGYHAAPNFPQAARATRHIKSAWCEG
ncbi:uncharacterized protein TrAFT101_003069 [Trichoderma asperellum]|uniref:uncharacterized protein n=1 Tax=Trichoderma asperellum TaxID=101201 RepID=UPI003321DDDB|nr:hypothetical protein TrAFT101_003069 [Trichoderma asperellum]